ncbi:MAG: hypothetical protein GDA54_06165 [Alphaproteobacteria bacterium GM7ARS4]|nr:hypothetical protein [Alphaproteobacteria bacterium GM7ARS4]
MPIVKFDFKGNGADGEIHGRDILEHWGPTAYVSIGKPIDVYHQFQQQGNTGVRMSREPFYALMDTGATCSSIRIDVAQNLGLKVVDKQPLRGVTGVEQHPIYLGFIMIKNVPAMNVYGRLFGIHADNLAPHRVILGRDFMRGGLFIYDSFSGHFSFAK